MSVRRVVEDTDIGAGLSIVNGKLTARLAVTKLPLYEYLTIWAEETGALELNSTQWSWGNGDIGRIGLPFGEGWEVVSMSFQADVAAADSSVTVELSTVTNSTVAPVTTMDVITNTHGGAGDAYRHEVFDTPIPVNSSVPLGFTTRSINGNIQSARVGARLRRQIGEYVSDVQLEDAAPIVNAVPTLPADTGTIVIDNFSDQFGSFALAMRNQTNTAATLQALISNVPYGDLSFLNPGAYTLVTDDNLDGTFTHLITSAAPVAGFATLSISGNGGPTPAGTGGNITLYSG